MIKNVGTLDRAIRIFLAIVFAALIFTHFARGAGIVITFAVVGFYLLLTGILSFCPLYTIIGFHSLRTKSGVDD